MILILSFSGFQSGFQGPSGFFDGFLNGPLQFWNYWMYRWNQMDIPCTLSFWGPWNVNVCEPLSFCLWCDAKSHHSSHLSPYFVANSVTNSPPFSSFSPNTYSFMQALIDRVLIRRTPPSMLWGVKRQTKAQYMLLYDVYEGCLNWTSFLFHTS